MLPLALPQNFHDRICALWIHYIELRCGRHQKEHMDIAELCKGHFTCQFPTVAKALEWCDDKRMWMSHGMDIATLFRID